MYSVHIPRCNHIKTNGTQCGSPALRGRRYCFFHKNWRGERIQLNAPRQAGAVINLPVLEDADSIQVALMQVMRLVLAGQIDSKMAGLLLYGLQTASLNLRQMQLEPSEKDEVVVVPEWTSQTGVGDKAWCEEDFEEQEEDEDDEDDEKDEDEECEEADQDDDDDEDDDEETVKPAVGRKPPASAPKSDPQGKPASVARLACPELVEGPSPASVPSRVAATPSSTPTRCHPDERNPPPDLRPRPPEEFQRLSPMEQLRLIQDSAEKGSWAADLSSYLLENVFTDPPEESGHS